MDTVSAAEFQSNCLHLLNQVNARTIGPLEITSDGMVLAVLVPPLTREEAAERLHGFMRGSVIIPEGFDLTAPVLDEPLDAEEGILHR